MSQQQDQIDAATADLKNVHGILSTAVPKITTGFETLETLITQAQQTTPGLDLSAFSTALTQVKADAQPLVTIVPVNAVPAPDAGTPPAPLQSGTDASSGTDTSTAVTP